MDSKKPWMEFWLGRVKLIQRPSEKIPTSQHGCDKCRNQAPCIDGEVEDWEVSSPFLCLKKKKKKAKTGQIISSMCLLGPPPTSSDSLRGTIQILSPKYVNVILDILTHILLTKNKHFSIFHTLVQSSLTFFYPFILAKMIILYTMSMYCVL